MLIWSAWSICFITDAINFWYNGINIFANILSQIVYYNFVLIKLDEFTHIQVISFEQYIL